MKLSYTALKTFQQCHFRYHLRYDRGLPSRPRPAAQSSRALHGALHLFHQGLKQPQTNESALLPPAAISLDTLLAHFKGYYDNPTRPLTESQYQEGRALLTQYWEAHRGQFPTPYLLEEPFKLHVGPFLWHCQLKETVLKTLPLNVKFRPGIRPSHPTSGEKTRCM